MNSFTRLSGQLMKVAQLGLESLTQTKNYSAFSKLSIAQGAQSLQHLLTFMDMRLAVSTRRFPGTLAYQAKSHTLNYSPILFSKDINDHQPLPLHTHNSSNEEQSNRETSTSTNPLNLDRYGRKDPLDLKALDNQTPLIEVEDTNKSGEVDTVFKVFKYNDLLVLKFEWPLETDPQEQIDQVELPFKTLPYIIRNLERYILPEARDLGWDQNHPCNKGLPNFNEEETMVSHQGSGFDSQYESRDFGNDYCITIENYSRKPHDNKSISHLISLSENYCERTVLPALKEVAKKFWIELFPIPKY